MDRTESEMAQALNAFATTRDATQMQRAFEAAEAAERDLEAPSPTQRRQALDRRLRLFAALDAALDAEWDVGKVPLQGVAPPASHRGMVRGTGEVDPADIADPDERAGYVQALQASKAAVRAYDLQFQLRRLDAHALQRFERLLERLYPGAADRAEFEAALAAAPLGAQRREQLRALLPAPR